MLTGPGFKPVLGVEANSRGLGTPGRVPDVHEGGRNASRTGDRKLQIDPAAGTLVPVVAQGHQILEGTFPLQFLINQLQVPFNFSKLTTYSRASRW